MSLQIGVLVVPPKVGLGTRKVVIAAMAPKGLQGEPYVLEWHVYDCFKFIGERCSQFIQDTQD